MMWLRRGLYRIGVRPRGGSIWYSPSLDMVYASKGFTRVFQEAMEKTRKEMDDGSTT